MLRYTLSFMFIAQLDLINDLWNVLTIVLNSIFFFCDIEYNWVEKELIAFKLFFLFDAKNQINLNLINLFSGLDDSRIL